MEPHMAIDLLKDADVAKMLGIKPDTLRIWRLAGKGPKFLKIGTHNVRYRRETVEAWLAAQEFSSTAEYADKKALA
jgi:predicted DNA-binding transcriptional regulator AlpA